MKSISSEMSELNLSAFGDGYMSEGEFDDEFLNNTNPEEKCVTFTISFQLYCGIIHLVKINRTLSDPRT